MAIAVFGVRVLSRRRGLWSQAQRGVLLGDVPGQEGSDGLIRDLAGRSAVGRVIGRGGLILTVILRRRLSTVAAAKRVAAVERHVDSGGGRRRRRGISAMLLRFWFRGGHRLFKGLDQPGAI
jgi:hypothetical protein